MKKGILLVLGIVFVLTSVVLFSQAEVKKNVTFTKAELAKYNGQNGAAAYVAVDGVVYDVSMVPAWKGGVHKGIKAGQDVTDLIKKAPHGMLVLAKLLTVGKLVDSTTTQAVVVTTATAVTTPVSVKK